MKKGAIAKVYAIILTALARATGAQPFAVTSDLGTATEIGRKMLKHGGNAVDAAVATTICLGAINSFSSGLGGGGFLLLKKGETATGYNFREKAFETAASSVYSRPSDSQQGRTSIGVPGEIKGLYTVHREHGRLPWSFLFRETVEILERGFQVHKILALKIKEHLPTILKDPGLYETYTRHGEAYREGDTIKRPNLAGTLRVLARDPESFYSGEIAEKLLSFINRPKTYATPKDFSSYAVDKMRPLEISFTTEDASSFSIFSLSLPTSGYMMAISMFALASIKRGLDTLSEREFQRLLVHLYNSIYKKREELEDFIDEESNYERTLSLLNNKYLQKLISELNAISENVDVSPSTVKILEDHGTTHLNVIDRDGMIVALTSTINFYWGSGLMDPSTGIILNNQIDDFTFDYANLSGVSGSFFSKNRIAPLKRPLSSAMPSIIMYRDRVLIIGGSGGIRIPSSVITIVARVLFRDTSLEEAIRYPRLHHQGNGVINLENNYPDGLADDTSFHSYRIEKDRPEAIASCVQGILVDYSHPTSSAPYQEAVSIHAFADERKNGCSVVGV
ncbi:gamma-glutamyltranspeptidase / glutathione hydrolase / leukotriene-C4 hydrolase [Nematocida displodere]|uniref:Glutathione hydrolase n=1 Tax=Nematocida displodere TaxID=1805483 RepID=A0A177EJ48_9MICR|nr:gamma-glutamyltranspeptidase / glutathione hydrolase / leukotriene-C4 hydrolase [Nematocida displodere]